MFRTSSTPYTPTATPAAKSPAWVRCALLLLTVAAFAQNASASSHREAPLIGSDPLADNVDLYAFRTPDDSETITMIATYVPFQLPQGGPNYYRFGDDVRYEIHIDNDAAVAGDEIVYRFTFQTVNEDPHHILLRSPRCSEPKEHLYPRAQQ